MSVKKRVNIEQGVLREIVSEIHERFAGACEYTYGDETSDCGNWSTCRPECALRRLRELAGLRPRKNGSLTPLTAAESEKVVIAAATLYDARRVLRRLFGDQYDSKAESWRELIRLLQDGRSVLETLIECLKIKDPQLADAEAIWLMAAAADLMEEEPKARES